MNLEQFLNEFSGIFQDGSILSLGISFVAGYPPEQLHLLFRLIFY